MIQDIAPDRLENAYSPLQPCDTDFAAAFDADGRLLSDVRDGEILFPTGKQVSLSGAVYLFAAGGRRYFLSREGVCACAGFAYRSMRELRDQGHGTALFAAFTAYHLWRWYADNRFCGRCGAPMAPHASERALQCGVCGYVVYPRLNPAVIVGVIRGESLLITRYRAGYAHNALVAGFAEIGETLEQTVEREVMEETGVRVKAIRYYKSQPWGMAQDILAGFYCEADGDAEVRADGTELKYAAFVPRREIELQPNDLSLTNEMMKRFRDGEPC
ncbi:MAG: NUDIX domain-containing protein [Clostridia bacterium]|nr:NUDIX domain-containing protein [Clostridia bacterium]